MPEAEAAYTGVCGVGGPDGVRCEMHAGHHGSHRDFPTNSARPEHRWTEVVLPTPHFGTDVYAEIAAERERHRGGGPDLALLRAELIQVAAMSSAWADRLGFELTSRPGGSEPR